MYSAYRNMLLAITFAAVVVAGVFISRTTVSRGVLLGEDTSTMLPEEMVYVEICDGTGGKPAVSLVGLSNGTWLGIEGGEFRLFGVGEHMLNGCTFGVTSKGDIY